jgi:hypothetical protein
MIALGKEGVGDVIDTLLCTPYNGQILTNSAPSGKQVAWPTVQAQILALCRQPHPPTPASLPSFQVPCGGSFTLRSCRGTCAAQWGIGRREPKFRNFPWETKAGQPLQPSFGEPCVAQCAVSMPSSLHPRVHQWD